MGFHVRQKLSSIPWNEIKSLKSTLILMQKILSNFLTANDKLYKLYCKISTLKGDEK